MRSVKPNSLNWSEKFSLSEAYLVTEKKAGIYLWGFNNGTDDIVWYVGQSKKVYARLRKHYLDIMSGQYQIPKHYLGENQRTPGCKPLSAWNIGGHHTTTANLIKDWTTMQQVFQAGHAFAHSAFARIAVVSEDQLDEAEKAAIADLQPHINKRDTKSNVPIDHIETFSEKGWVELWKKVRDKYKQPSAIVMANHSVERDRPQAALVGPLRGFAAAAAPHVKR